MIWKLLCVEIVVCLHSNLTKSTQLGLVPICLALLLGEQLGLVRICLALLLGDRD